MTAAFDLNLLERINCEAGGRFDADAFRHVAVWNADQSRIEMHLESRVDQSVAVADRTIRFAAGERVCTEHSHKFTPDAIEALGREAGWRLDQVWTDAAESFAVALFV